MPRKPKAKATPEVVPETKTETVPTGAVTNEQYAYTPYGKAKVISNKDSKVVCQFPDGSKHEFDLASITIAK